MTMLAVDHPDWTEQAVCRSTDPELWFPEKGGSVADAKRICASCPVQLECLAYALAVGEVNFGVWGGLDPRQRRRLDPRPPGRGANRRAIRHGTEGGYNTHRLRDEAPCAPCRLAASAAWKRRKVPA